MVVVAVGRGQLGGMGLGVQAEVMGAVVGLEAPSHWMWGSKERTWSRSS